MMSGTKAPIRGYCHWSVIVTIAALASIPSTGKAQAQDVNSVAVNTIYHGASTDWCPANEGVPTTVTMHGPNIIKGFVTVPGMQGPNIIKEFVTVPGKVVVRKGGHVEMVAKGENTASMWKGKEIDRTVIGKFKASFQVCSSLWTWNTASGSWQVIGLDGEEIKSGKFDRENVRRSWAPFFGSVLGSREIGFAKLDGQFLFTLPNIKTTITQTLVAEPAKE